MDGRGDSKIVRKRGRATPFFRKKADVAADVTTTKPTIETLSSDGSFEHIED